MKYFILLLLLLPTITTASLSTLFNQAKEVDKQLEGYENNLQIAEIHRENSWAHYLNCKSRGLPCIHDTRPVAKKADEEVERILALKKEQTEVWAKYEACRDNDDCPEPAIPTPNANTCSVDLVLRNDTKDARATYAYRLSGCDKNFVLMITAENSARDMNARNVNRNGTVDSNICQINHYYHPTIARDPRFKTDPYWVIQQCWRLYSGGTTFYGYSVRHRRINEVRFY